MEAYRAYLLVYTVRTQYTLWYTVGVSVIGPMSCPHARMTMGVSISIVPHSNGSDSVAKNEFDVVLICAKNNIRESSQDSACKDELLGQSINWYPNFDLVPLCCTVKEHN